MAYNPFLVPTGYEVIPNVSAMSGYTDIKKLSSDSNVLIGRKKTPANFGLTSPLAGPTLPKIANSTPAVVGPTLPKATVAPKPSVAVKSVAPKLVSRSDDKSKNLTYNINSGKLETKKATLYGPNGEKRIVDVGSGTASELQSQGWGLTPGGYKAPRFNLATATPSTANSTPAIKPKSTTPYQTIGGDPFKAVAPLIQGPARSGAAVGLDIASALSKLNVPGFSKGQDYSQLSIDKKSPGLQQNIQRALFGEEPVKSMSRQTADFELAHPKVPTPLIVAGVAGLTSLDFTGLGGENKAVKALAKAGDAVTAGKILKEMGVTDDIIRETAEHFAKTTDTATIKKSLDGITKVQKAVAKASAQTDETFDAGKYVKEMVDKREAARTAGNEKTTLGKILDNVNRSLSNAQAPLETPLRQNQKQFKYEIMPKNNISDSIDRALRAPSIGNQFIKTQGLADVVKEADNMDELGEYLIAKQALTVEKRGVNTGRDLAKDAKLVETLAPKYEGLARKTTEYSQKLLDYSVESGLISPDLAKKLKETYPDYVPLNRVFSEIERSGIGEHGSSAVASLSDQSIVKALKGSDREIEDPITSLWDRTTKAFQQGERNKAAKTLVSYADLPDNPYSLRKLADGEKRAFDKGYISVLNNGKKEVWETTKDIERAAKSLDVEQMDTVMKILAAPSRLKRLGTTAINIPFALSNVIRDPVTAFINSKRGLKTSILNPFLFAESLYETLGHGKYYQEMLDNGALTTSFDISRNQLPLTIAKARAGRSVGARVKYVARNPSELLSALENIIGRSEEFNRIKQYIGTKKSALKEGYSLSNAVAEAANSARNDTVNFARFGEQGRLIRSAWLYLQANIRGISTLMTSLRDRPAQTATKIALAGLLPTASATLWNMTDEKRRAAYDDIADYEKEKNIIIVPDNPTKDKNGVWNVIKIPVSQEIANLTNLTRRIMEQLHDGDPVKAKEVATGLLGTISPVEPTFSGTMSSIMPTALLPTAEGYANKSFYTGKPLVSEYAMKNLSPKNQKDDWTSATAVKIGEKLNISPAKTENWIKSTLGGIGSQALNASDNVMVRAGMIKPEEIGGKNLRDALSARLFKATGGASDDNSVYSLQGQLQQNKDKDFETKKKAEKFYAGMENLPKEEKDAKLKELFTTDRDFYDAVETVILKKQKDLTYSDKLLLEFSVKDGDRAKAIFGEMNKLKTQEEKDAYLQDLFNKKILSKKVNRHLKELISQNK